MPLLTNKGILMAAIQTVEGVYASPTNSDAIRFREQPTLDFSQDTVTSLPAGGTLSPEAAIPGRSSATASIAVDLAGSGTHSTAPRWSRLVQACGLQELAASAISAIPITSPTNGPFLLGERVTANTEVGIVVGTTATTLYVTWEGADPFDDLDDIVGQTSGAEEASSGAPAANHGVRWMADSEAQVTITTTGTMSPMPSAGNVVHFNAVADAVATGGGQVISASGTTLVIRHSFGVISNDDNIENMTVVDNSIGAITSSGGITQSRGPNLSLRYFQDGLDRTGLGFRGNWAISASAGEAAVLTCTYDGQHRSDVASASPGAAAFGATAIAPITEGDTFYIDGMKFAVRSLNLESGQDISAAGDMNSTGGTGPARITKRGITLNFDIEAVLPGTIDFAAAIQAQSFHRAAFQLGDTTGNWTTFILPRVQITERSLSDDDGVVSMSGTMNAIIADTSASEFPDAPAGDNEIIICHL